MRRLLLLLALATAALTASGQAVGLLLRADSLSAANRPADALAAYARADSALRARPTAPPRSWRLRLLAGQARCHRLVGDYRAALRAYEAMRREGLLDIRAALNLSNLYLTLGLYTDAVGLLEPLRPAVGQTTRLLNLASAYAYLGRPADALALLDTAATDSLPAAGQATLWANRGFIALSVGRHAEAAASLRTALALTADSAERCIVRANLALAESKCGHTSEALAQLDTCLGWQSAHLGQRHPDYAISVRKRAEVLLDAGRPAEAADEFERYFNLTRDYVCRSFGFLTEKQRQDFWYTHHPLVAECFATEDARPRLLYDVALFSKGLLLQVGRDFEASARRDTATARLYAAVADLRRRAGADSLAPGRREALHAAADACERDLLRRMPDYRQYTAALRLTAADVSARLSPGEAAVEFVRYDDSGTSRYAALVATPGGTVRHVGLWTEDSLRHFRLAGGATVADALASLHAGDKDALYADSTLSAYVWRPLADVLDSHSRVYFSPDGLLHLLAVEHLPDARQGRARLMRLSSTRELCLSRPAPAPRALVMGGLSYDDCDRSGHKPTAQPDRSASRVLASLGLPPAARSGYAYLPATADEADSVSRLLRRTWPEADVACLKGRHGSEEAFKSHAPGCGLIHMATHGFCFVEADVAEPLVYCRDSLREDATLDRSGLIMAGANRMVRPAFSAYDDGVLLSREVASLHLDSAALVVLSACQTGLGPVTPEGVFGLQRGLKKAGAGALLVSLWNVDDRATRLLMTRFYTHLAGGATMTDALRMAQDDVRRHAVSVDVETNEDDTTRPQVRRLGRWVWPKKTRPVTLHPYADPRYWAAFVLIDGAGR